MSSFSGKIRDSFSKFTSSRKTNASLPKLPPKDVKSHDLSRSVMKPAAIDASDPSPVAGRSVKEVDSDIPYRLDMSGGPEAVQNNERYRDYIIEMSRPVMNQFFETKLSDGDFGFLIRNNFHVYQDEGDSPCLVQEKAMKALVSLLQARTNIDQMDFTVVKGDIRFTHLPILFDAISNDKLPRNDTRWLLTFPALQFVRDEKLFEQAKETAKTEKADIYVRMVNYKGDVLGDKDIRTMEFSELLAY